MRRLSILFLLCLFYFSGWAQNKASVSFESWLSLVQASNPVISEDGNSIAFSLTYTHWQSNSYDSEIWLKTGSQPAFQLTRTAKGGSRSPEFTQNGKWLSFLADRGNKTQVYIIPIAGGEALQVTYEEEGVKDYAWSHNGTKLAFIKDDPESASEKGTHNRYGAYDIEDSTFTYSHLWVQGFNLDSFLNRVSSPCYHGKVDSGHVLINSCFRVLAPVRLTKGRFTVTGLAWSPDDQTLAIDIQPDPRVKSSSQSDIALVDPVHGQLTKIISHSGSDNFGAWSPNGKEIVYSSGLENTTSNFYKNNHILIYSLSSQSSRELAGAIDEDKSIVGWNLSGIYFLAADKMKTVLWNLDPGSGKLLRDKLDLDIINAVDFSKDGKSLAITGRNFKDLVEVYSLKAKGKIQTLTQINAQIAGWKTPINEIISWKSKDSSVIEGVLLKPSHYDPAKKYPLLVVIHGGPTGTDRPEPTPTYVYPIMEWCEKGALVLRVNYRGSAGYGEKFRSLNVNNLGIGDMWDVLSGIDYLNKKGLIDTSRMGCMGWSQGGYISAFLTTHTHIFKAISVGAGISDWMTYYVNTDITPFTPQYLNSTPWSNPELYQKTSPISTINQASTPTLIQHGELDKRVPIPNAYELYRGLLDRGVPSRFMIYKGFGHGITKPKERLAAVWHNWQWFNHYVFGEPEEIMPIN